MIALAWFRFTRMRILLGITFCLAIAGYGVAQWLLKNSSAATTIDQVVLEEPIVDAGELPIEVIHEIPVRVKHVNGSSAARILGGGLA